MTTTTLTFAGFDALFKTFFLVSTEKVSDFPVSVRRPWMLVDPAVNNSRVLDIERLPRQINQQVVSVVTSASNNLRRQMPRRNESLFTAGGGIERLPGTELRPLAQPREWWLKRADCC